MDGRILVAAGHGQLEALLLATQPACAGTGGAGRAGTLAVQSVVPVNEGKVCGGVRGGGELQGCAL